MTVRLGWQGNKRITAFAASKAIGDANSYHVEKLTVFWVWFVGWPGEGAKHTCFADSDTGKTLIAWVAAHKGPIEGFMIG